MKNFNQITGRNRAFIGIAVVIILMLFSALIINISSGKNRKSDVNNANQAIVLEAITADEGNQIELRIYNKGEEIICCGLDYEIQIYKINRWKKYPYEIAVNTIGIEIQPGNSYVQIIELNNIDKGETYRIKKVIGEYEYYSNEFSLKGTFSHDQVTALPSASGR